MVRPWALPLVVRLAFDDDLVGVVGQTIEDQGDMMRSVRQLHRLQSLAADGLQEIAAA
jgi:hypothetical protein